MTGVTGRWRRWRWLKEPNDHKYQSDDQRGYLVRALRALKRAEVLLWMLSYLVRNFPSLRHLVDEEIERNNDLMEEVEYEASHRYKKSA